MMIIMIDFNTLSLLRDFVADAKYSIISIFFSFFLFYLVVAFLKLMKKGPKKLHTKIKIKLTNEERAKVNLIQFLIPFILTTTYIYNIL
jgi:Ca2+/Na+ antiporter